ncbi:small integral membrane protein 5 [Hemicordylus capensis]|uniref:small integral membrane protein 5 n=1 Tax=Hemicordylus capensis TaxID=884348 RepID=UPI0023022D94|nr:small integral membrane protein 5 [Hemicordylus capensis]XP_053157449.1 small integral membrane protein 5 [Hemicordylus capensis]
MLNNIRDNTESRGTPYKSSDFEAQQSPRDTIWNLPESRLPCHFSIYQFRSGSERTLRRDRVHCPGRMSYRNLQDEFYAIGEKLLLKLQKLPKADPVEIVAFCVIILFIATVLTMIVIACSCCCAHCCKGKSEHKGRRIQVQPAAHA